MLIFSCVLFSTLFNFVISIDSNYVPLHEDRENHLAIKQPKQMGCYFDGKLYELEEEWHPNLGPPFGIMICIKCKCLVMHKKKRVFGRVACENFVEKCATLTCENPTVLPDRCCKSCPGSDYAEPNVFGSSDFYDNDNSRDHGYQEFMAVLTGRFKQPTVATEGVGRVYVTICGVWTGVPLVYLKSLKRDELLIAITTAKQSDGALGGRIFRPKIINREVFGALLFPSTMQSVKNLGYGGVAVVDVEAGGDALNVAVWFDSAVNLSSGYSRNIFVSLEKDDGRRRSSQSTRAELIIKNGYYVAEKLISIGNYEQRWLNGGNLLVVIHAEFMEPSELVGLLLPKRSCDVYQAILTEDTIATNSNFQQTPEIVATVLLNVLNNSTVEYTIITSGFNTREAVGFTLDKENRRQRRRTVLSNDVMHGIKVENNKILGRSNGAVNLRDMESFYKEKLFFSLTLKNANLSLRGSVRRMPASDSVHGGVVPFLLSGKSRSSAGSLWLSNPASAVDRKKCSALKYTLQTTGLPVYKTDELKLSFCLGAFSSTTSTSCFFETSDFATLSTTSENQRPSTTIVGDVDENLNRAAWAAFDSGRVFVKMSTPIHPQGELYASNVVVSNDCWKRQVTHQEDMLVAEERKPDVSLKPVRLDCDFEGAVRKNGETFHSTSRNCTFCSCQRGSVKCERVLCPVLNCSTTLVENGGDCCPSCWTVKSTNGKRCYWMGDQRYHDTGSSWHPYIAPFGFSKCALCTCQHNEEVTCTKSACPELTCPKRLRFRENALDCCQKCRPANPDKPGSASISVLEDESGGNGRCQFNGRRYDEDTVFSPTVQHVTTLKCIQCVCRKGRVNCRRPMCSKLDCDDPVRKNGCCPKCIVKKVALFDNK